MLNLPRLSTIHQIREIIASKNWYRFTGDGVFSWKESLKKLEEELGINSQELEEIFTSSFSPAALTKVKRQKKGWEKQEEVPLLTALKDEDFPLFLWSVGDQSWQRKKFERVKMGRWISEDHCFFYSKDKEQGLLTIIERIYGQNESQRLERVLLVIVDDKIENLEKSEKVLRENKSSTQWLNYHLRINNPLANPDAFYHWILEKRRENPDRKITLILDFDGVVVDTQRVLLNVVPKKIFNRLRLPHQ